jgi:hypothetical protein
LPADSNVEQLIYIPAGGTSELAVKKVFATSPVPPTTLTAFITKQ